MGGDDEFYALIPFFFLLPCSFSLFLLRGEYFDLYSLALLWRLEGRGMERINDFSQCSMRVGAVMKTTSKFRMGRDMG